MPTYGRNIEGGEGRYWQGSERCRKGARAATSKCGENGARGGSKQGYAAAGVAGANGGCLWGQGGRAAPGAGSVAGFHVWKTGRVSAARRCASIRFIHTVTEAAPDAPGEVWMLRGDQSGAREGEGVSVLVCTRGGGEAGGCGGPLSDGWLAMGR